MMVHRIQGQLESPHDSDPLSRANLSKADGQGKSLGLWVTPALHLEAADERAALEAADERAAHPEEAERGLS